MKAAAFKDLRKKFVIGFLISFVMFFVGDVVSKFFPDMFSEFYSLWFLSRGPIIGWCVALFVFALTYFTDPTSSEVPDA